jgi:hypothetical protein
VSGVFYVPRGEFSMAGAANIGNGTGQCLELIASQVTISNGAAAGTTCSGLGGTSVAPPTIALVQ